MNDEEIKKIVEENMETKLKLVLNGTEDSVKIMYCKPDDILSYLNVECEDFDTNGYQWDYWFNVVVDGITYSVSGDGYYNNSLTFSKLLFRFPIFFTYG